MIETPHIRRTPPVMLRPERPTASRLTDLADHVGGTATSDVDVTGVTVSSTDLVPGDLFVAIRGANRHGAEFAADAARNGASAILTDSDGAEIASGSGLPALVVADPRGVLGDVAMAVYRTGPEDELPLLLATTGTNGKTSVTHLLEGMLTQIGVVSGASTSAERVVADERVVAGLTSPEASELHALMGRMRERDVEAFAVEVSAQAVTRRRVEKVIWDVIGFTNLTHEHLDDYGDMETYYRAKAPLFTSARSRRAVISLDSAAGDRIASEADIPVTTIATFGIATPTAYDHAHWHVEVTSEQQSGTGFRLTGPGGRVLETIVPVIGAHMAANAGLGIVMMLEAGYAWDRIAAALADGIHAWVPGRTQLVSGSDGPAVYVDFGHTPDAFEKTLAAVRRVTPGKVLMLFGADGDRDTTKRADMARAAVAGSDITVITDHHPRHEDAASIRATLMNAARAADPDHELHEVSPPEAAIVTAVSLVGDGDAILWAGPGHQNYRDIAGVQWGYSARELSRRALIAAGWPAPDRVWPNPYLDD
ncbi:UDP-N-acetylmuramoyl-L-alanyl-D-glutamate--2,6-diaminopimelate ligase [Microbacterium faecale]|uniref:UDP-N-acetylmuramoyl-L-alanyl-D-glutamate--2, 6-diaminopimelate ligase n=2 Tax=Microbacterium faecale TaxID=1804630 RepID=A0A917DFS0_9MICO|nr:UDP-N-acetylmuramoyl-L-alanyl-D-glutamate--2,6-diaminopimelate ligase [Microbacterium faecale]